MSADQFKVGSEFKPYHRDASHVEAYYRDGWNDCYYDAIEVIEEKDAALASAKERIEALEAALRLVAHSGKFQCFDDAAWDAVNAALTQNQKEEKR